MHPILLLPRLTPFLAIASNAGTMRSSAHHQPISPRPICRNANTYSRGPNLSEVLIHSPLDSRVHITLVSPRRPTCVPRTSRRAAVSEASLACAGRHPCPGLCHSCLSHC
ncbi:hypothetical protein N656DRAFT_53126 [Canariomyces notabilis]|uniref:Secreted protein n=1 Tax=Canariomyces notabilis TaxID=2074819 RepID=A0AAN6YXE6_9PEZI|nr:hypothetical protein N656DRAFT_53126 [Canariomyces arenarius]